MRGGSWRADLPGEGEGGQRTGKARPALEGLAAGPTAAETPAVPFWPLSAEDLRPTQAGLCLLALCVAAQGFSNACLLRTPGRFGCTWRRGCAAKTPCTPVAATCRCPQAPPLRLPVADGLLAVLLGRQRLCSAVWAAISIRPGGLRACYAVRGLPNRLVRPALAHPTRTPSALPTVSQATVLADAPSARQGCTRNYMVQIGDHTAVRPAFLLRATVLHLRVAIGPRHLVTPVIVWVPALVWRACSA